MILFALILVVLLGFAAVAIDGAAAWAQRRQNQSGADTGALAGGILIGDKPTGLALADATDEVIRISYQTMDPDMTLADWTDMWTSCADADRPPEFTLAGTSDCVSFTGDLSRIRVSLPAIAVPTTFGRILGRDFIETGAVAEAGTQASFSGGVLPFGLPGAVANDIEVCLKSGANPKTIAPCDGPDSGNFAFLDITQFGSIDLETTTQCNGATAARMARNIMQGVDHFLAAAEHPGDIPIVDRQVCGDGDFAVEPYTVTTETGNMTGVLHDGLVTGLPSPATPGRLARGTNTVELAGNDIDDTPLWAFLSDDGLALCGNPTSKAELVTCLDEWEESDGTIFTSAIGDSPRWAWVPLFWEDDLGSGSSDRTIREFRPVYVQSTLWKCKSSSCAIVHDPGEPVGGTGAGGGNTQIEAVSGIQIPIGALPPSIQKAQPGTDGDKEYVLIK